MSDAVLFIRGEPSTERDARALHAPSIDPIVQVRLAHGLRPVIAELHFQRKGSGIQRMDLPLIFLGHTKVITRGRIREEGVITVIAGLEVDPGQGP